MEIPLISDIAEFLGQAPVTTRTLAEAFGEGFESLDEVLGVFGTITSIAGDIAAPRQPEQSDQQQSMAQGKGEIVDQARTVPMMRIRALTRRRLTPR